MVNKYSLEWGKRSMQRLHHIHQHQSSSCGYNVASMPSLERMQRWCVNTLLNSLSHLNMVIPQMSNLNTPWGYWGDILRTSGSHWDSFNTAKLSVDEVVNVRYITRHFHCDSVGVRWWEAPCADVESLGGG